MGEVPGASWRQQGAAGRRGTSETVSKRRFQEWPSTPDRETDPGAARYASCALANGFVVGAGEPPAGSTVIATVATAELRCPSLTR